MGKDVIVNRAWKVHGALRYRAWAQSWSSAALALMLKLKLQYFGHLIAKS